MRRAALGLCWLCATAACGLVPAAGPVPPPDQVEPSDPVAVPPRHVDAPRGAPSAEPVAAAPSQAAARACAAGDDDACLALGPSEGGAALLAELRAQGAKQSVDRLACARGNAISCDELTLWHGNELGQLISRRRFLQHCDAGEAEACYRVAIRYLLGLGGLPKRIEEGSRLLTAACEGGYGGACYHIAQDYRTGSPRVGGVVDEQRYRTMLARSCQAGWADGCAEAAALPPAPAD